MFKRIMETWDRIELGLAAFTIAAALVICFIEVIARMVFSFSFYWAKEYILFAIIWSTFLSSSSVLKKNKHIRLSILVDLLPVKIRKYLEILTTIVGFIFCIFLTISGISLVTDAYTSGVASTSLAKTPLWIPYSIMPIAGFLFTIRFGEHFVMLTLNKDSISETAGNNRV